MEFTTSYCPNPNARTMVNKGSGQIRAKIYAKARPLFQFKRVQAKLQTKFSGIVPEYLFFEELELTIRRL